VQERARARWEHPKGEAWTRDRSHPPPLRARDTERWRETTGPCQTVTRGSGRYSGPTRDRIEERAPSKTVTARGVRDQGESVGSHTVTPGRDAPSAPFHEGWAPSEAVTARGVRYCVESAVNRFEFTPIGGGAGTRPSRGTNGHRSHPLPRESLRGRGETVRLDRFPTRDRGTATVARGFRQGSDATLGAGTNPPTVTVSSAEPERNGATLTVVRPVTGGRRRLHGGSGRDRTRPPGLVQIPRRLPEKLPGEGISLPGELEF
jgi:hypothetical protein